ncbi:hypothetical protein [Yoonia sediminilitoris]|uniref:Uncharacterized protein n=1 Tax=Yoonia sediminilitoris TaxID=1286148 RepID=A0A2T6KF13_9RHOB|nr:hypothetical protein [Yoonia sediminilitoris]PUB13719.1 hypothetical protein C8N45_107180 [Yoonia sediminilitoris]RCW94889.1 hypothetical protein DFP92_107180 [Yoonia sediminilitoris]
MEDQQVDWAEYARAQDELKKSTTVNDRHWGLEAALGNALTDIESGKHIDRSDTERRIQSGARKNRHRARLLRLQPLTWQPDIVDPTANYETSSELVFLCTAMGGDDYNLMKNVAGGATYGELSGIMNAETSAIRKRVSRIRMSARNLLPQQ